MHLSHVPSVIGWTFNGHFLRNGRTVSVFSLNWDLEHKYIKVREVWRLLGTKMN